MSFASGDSAEDPTMYGFPSGDSTNSRGESVGKSVDSNAVSMTSMMLPSHVVFLDAITPQQQAESDARSYRALVGATPVEICLRHPFTKDHSGYNPSNQGREAAKTKKISMTMAEAQILFKCHHPSIHILLGTVILDMGPALSGSDTRKSPRRTRRTRRSEFIFQRFPRKLLTRKFGVED